MTNKITLITPPDFYENSNLSVLFLGLTDDEQEVVSKWFSENNSSEEINFYVYQGENNVPWLMYALNRSDVTYLNLDHNSAILRLLSSYMLGRPQVYYSTSNLDMKNLMEHINNKYVDNVTTFLERAVHDKI